MSTIHCLDSDGSLGYRGLRSEESCTGCLLLVRLLGSGCRGLGALMTCAVPNDALFLLPILVCNFMSMTFKLRLCGL